jgi:hypothetical protein
MLSCVCLGMLSFSLDAIVLVRFSLRLSFICNNRLHSNSSTVHNARNLVERRWSQKFAPKNVFVLEHV